jgi:hypothetical protein
MTLHNEHNDSFHDIKGTQTCILLLPLLQHSPRHSAFIYTHTSDHFLSGKASRRLSNRDYTYTEMADAARGAFETGNESDSVPELIDDSTDLSDSTDVVIKSPFKLERFQRKRAGLLIKALRHVPNVTYAIKLADSIAKLLEHGSFGIVLSNLVDRFAVMICDYLINPAEEPLPRGSMKMIANSIANIVLQRTSNDPLPPISNAGTALAEIEQIRDARFPAAIQTLVAGWLGWENSLSVIRNPLYSLEGQDETDITGPFTPEEMIQYTLDNFAPDSYHERMQQGNDEG